MSPTVHVLLFGKVLCGSVHGLPCNWGTGHRWVNIMDRNLATCAECKGAASQLADTLLGNVPLDVGAVPADVVQVDLDPLSDTSDVGVKRI